MNINVFLPCRKGSQRVPKKNIKPFADYEYGLLEIKIIQLINTKNVNKIIISTDDDEVIKFSKNFDSSKIIIHKRDSYLASSDCSTDKLVAHAATLVSAGDILWTHVTSPFLNSELYDKIIEKYYKVLKLGFDSLMTVNTVQTFLWNNNGPINYDRKVEKWPRTQTLKPIFEINSGVFLANKNIFLKTNDRIGKKPFMYKLNKLEGFDVDDKDDFTIAENMQIVFQKKSKT